MYLFIFYEQQIKRELLKPTVFHEVFQVNSADAAEGVGEATVGNGNEQTHHQEHRRYGYKGRDHSSVAPLVHTHREGRGRRGRWSEGPLQQDHVDVTNLMFLLN